METTTIKSEILQLVSDEIDQWLIQQKDITDGYTYESEFIKVSQRINKIILTKSVGKLPGDRNKKNFRPVLEK